jgi:tight adherence protein C
VATDSRWPIVVAIVVCTLSGWLLYAVMRAWSVRQRSLARIEEEGEPQAQVMGPTAHAGWLAQWLSRAGYRQPGAAFLFVSASIAATVVGAIEAVVFSRTLLGGMVQVVGNLPGGIGEVFVAILGGGPWIVFLITALSPTLLVRAARRRRVRDVEQDMPLALELFATLAEAGLGFDSALSRIVDSQPDERPLRFELVGFQRDVRAGVPRVTALRRLAERLDVMSATIFVSAIIQSEQVGASIAETLRYQADDLRVRRREQALLLAQALPVKLVFPLISCFLPGIFVSTLGPVLYQMIQVADSVLRPAAR